MKLRCISTLVIGHAPVPAAPQAHHRPPARRKVRPKEEVAETASTTAPAKSIPSPKLTAAAAAAVHPPAHPAVAHPQAHAAVGITMAVVVRRQVRRNAVQLI